MFYQANSPCKQAEVAILIAAKVQLTCKLVKGDKEGHFILIKGAINSRVINNY
jgi:hypothetical protein